MTGIVEDMSHESDNSDDFAPSANLLVERNALYADTFAAVDRQAAPRRRLVVVACMDARIDIFGVLGLEHGDAHVIRNAGGVVTDDVVRSVTLSQRALGTREIILVHHTDCGLHAVDEAAFRAELGAEFGVTPPWSLEAFGDPYDDVRQSMKRLALSPFVAHDQHIRGFVYDVDTGRLQEVAP